MPFTKSTFDGKEEIVADLVPRAKVAIELAPVREISGDFITDSWYFAATEIVFKKGARLIFSFAAQSRRTELFVVARKITVEDGIGVITYQRASPSVQADRGQAASGGGGQGEGAHGSPGANGAQGATGIAGQGAPDLSIFVSALGGSGNIEIDTKGGDGGAGGTGQRGGDGGAGAQGTHARQASQGLPFGGRAWLPSCEAGPGWGGTGGSGGSGGPGGTGGVGGRGGNITLCADPSVHQVLTAAVNSFSDGGAGGVGGEGGTGGAGGVGGAEGALANFCSSAGRVGPNGAPGGQGAKGDAGTAGTAGALFVVAVSNATSDGWFGF